MHSLQDYRCQDNLLLSTTLRQESQRESFTSSCYSWTLGLRDDLMWDFWQLPTFLPGMKISTGEFLFQP